MGGGGANEESVGAGACRYRQTYQGVEVGFNDVRSSAGCEMGDLFAEMPLVPALAPNTH